MTKNSNFSSRYFTVTAISVIFLLIVVQALYCFFTISSLTSNLALLQPPEDPVYIEKAIAQTAKNFKDTLISFSPILGVLFSALVGLTVLHHKT